MKYIGILDFDKFLFRNYDFNLTDKYLTLDKIVTKEEFIKKYNINLEKLSYQILLTGRRKTQIKIIEDLLKKGKHSINHLILYPIYVEDYHDEFNWIDYWRWKARWIVFFNKEIKTFREEYRLIVFDDDKVICAMCDTFKIRNVLIDTTINEDSRWHCFNCFRHIPLSFPINYYERFDSHKYCIKCHYKKEKTK